MSHERTRAVWGASPAGTTHALDESPGTRGFFEKVLASRSRHELPWLFELIPFSSFRGKKVLELGCGAGYDAFEFCRNQADYTGIDITPENIERTRHHLALFGYAPRLEEADAEALPFADDAFDVVFSNGVLHHTPNLENSFQEAHRVLRPGGSFWVLLYHKNSIFHWLSLWLTNHILRGGFRHQSFTDRLSRIEFTTSSSLPLVNVYTRRQLRERLRAAGFRGDEMYVRKLVAADLPDIPVLRRLWARIPQRVLDKLGKRWGWYVIAHAVKG